MPGIREMVRKASQVFDMKKEGNYQKINDAKDVPPVPDLPSGSRPDSLQKLLYAEPGTIEPREAKQLFKDATKRLKDQFEGLEDTKLADGRTFGKRFDDKIATALKTHKGKQMDEGLKSSIFSDKELTEKKVSRYSAQSYLGDELKKLQDNVKKLQAQKRSEGTPSRRPEE